jgi:DNA-binding beta-propeller fold protein YncE
LKIRAEYLNTPGGIYATPDGTTAIAIHKNGTISAWDFNTGKTRWTANYYDSLRVFVQAGGHSVATTPDGKSIFVQATNEKVEQLYVRLDVQTGAVLRQFGHHPIAQGGLVADFVVTPDGKYLLSYLFSGVGFAIDVWNPATGSKLKTIHSKEGTQYITSRIVLTEDGKRFVVYSTDGTFEVWDIEKGKVIDDFDAEDNDDHKIVTGSFTVVGSNLYVYDDRMGSFPSQRLISVFDIQKGKFIRSYALNAPGGFGTTYELNSSHRDPYLLLNATLGAAKALLLDTRDGSSVPLEALDGMTSFAFLPGSDRIIFNDLDRTGIYDIQKKQIIGWRYSVGRRGDYVVLEPNGRFDATQDAMKAIYYSQGFDILPLESFFEECYTPGLLASVLSGKELPPIRSTVDFKKALKLPPAVTITSPKPGQQFTTDAVSVTLEATDQGGGVDEIRLYHNDKVVNEEQRGMKPAVAAATKATKSYQITLLPGVNTLRATAFNTDRTEAIPFEMKIELKAAEASLDLYILAVGINEYKNAKYNLNYGRPDAQAFVGATDQRGKSIFKQIIKEEVYDQEATREGIEKAFQKIIAAAKPQDAFVFYYAGHGVMSEGKGNSAPEFYLIPRDVTQLYGDDEQLATRGIAAKLLKDFCARVKSQKQLIILDACQSGGAVETFAMRGAAEEKAMAQLARSAGVVVLAATGTEQFASEFKQLGHGIFTYALINGLQGRADGSPKDGKITVAELKAYLDDQIPELTKQYRGSVQYPTAYIRGQDFPIGVAQ